MTKTIDQLADAIVSFEATITAAAYRQLVAIREFDELAGWYEQGATSCSAWLGWKIGMSGTTAREKVRVAHALADLPEIRAAFEAGKVSYSQVRAMTRIASADGEAEWLNIAFHSTADQLERIVRECRVAKMVAAPDRAAVEQEARSVITYVDDSGMLVVKARLPAVEGARVKQILDALQMEQPAEGDTHEQRRADALVEMAERAAVESAGTGAGHRRSPQLVVHVEELVLSNEQRGGRCEVQNGPGASAEAVRRVACDAEKIVMTHGADGQLVGVGRKGRVISTALRRAVEERDRGCRFPGCGNTIVDGHHIVHWADGGETTFENIISLCRRHHSFVHERGYSVERVGNEVLFTPPAAAPLSRGSRLPDAPVWYDQPRAGGFVRHWDGETPDYDYIAEVMPGVNAG